MAQDMVIVGTCFHGVSQENPLVLLSNAVVGVKDGKICFFESNLETTRIEELCIKHGIDKISIRHLKTHQFLMPGLIDTHIHAPQYTYAGNGYSVQLLEWLKKYTFPTEAKFKDVTFARDAYDKVVRRTLRNGTTTASYYATIHTDSCIVLAELMQKYGQRGFVGKVNMDEGSPDYYREETAESLTETRRFVTVMKSKFDDGGLIEPCITPRFALSCTPELMRGLAAIAQEFRLPIQTHMSENRDEIQAVKEKYKVDEYVQVYKNCGLLSERTILAHCVYSNDTELEIIKNHRSGISHCPNSNISLQSGLMDTRKVERSGVKLGLGTDVSGGYSPSVFDAIRKAIEVSKILKSVLHFDDASYSSLSHKEAFYLATMGGATVMGLEKRIGNFEVGKEFDALVVDGAVDDSPYDIFGFNSEEDLIEKFLFCGDDRNIIEVYVSGRKVNVDG